MYKVFIVLLLVFSGCSNIKVTGAMCEKINQEGGEVPQECQAYSQEKADKAFNKVTEDKKVSNKDIEFDKEKE